jgi:hypothetical protein
MSTPVDGRRTPAPAAAAVPPSHSHALAAKPLRSPVRGRATVARPTSRLPPAPDLRARSPQSIRPRPERPRNDLRVWLLGMLMALVLLLQRDGWTPDQITLLVIELGGLLGLQNYLDRRP